MDLLARRAHSFYELYRKLRVRYPDEGLEGLLEEAIQRLADEGLLSLRAPVKRVGGFDTAYPLYRLENHYLPTTHRILEACRAVLDFE